MTVGALIGPYLFGELATKVNLRQRNLPPFTLDNGFLYVLGADSLGRSLLARIIVGAQTSLAISACVVVVSMIVGGTLGIVAGYVGGWTSTIIMRLTDVIFSFPSLLMALIVLYILGPSILNVIAILSIDPAADLHPDDPRRGAGDSRADVRQRRQGTRRVHAQHPRSATSCRSSSRRSSPSAPSISPPCSCRNPA